MDWLPTQEKQWVLDKKVAYLYGTELPDNSQAADGIGDTGKHHVYFSANGSLQDDAAAIRAGEEHRKAVDAFNKGNLSEAASARTTAGLPAPQTRRMRGFTRWMLNASTD